MLLIAGGASKGADFSALGTTIAAGHVRAVLLIGQEAPRIAAAIQRVGAGEIAHCCRDLPQALDTARHLAQPGDVVLLSPACASFDQFSSYAERGDLFKRLVIGPSKTIAASSLYERPDLLYFVDRRQKIHSPAQQRWIRTSRRCQPRISTNR